MTLWRSSKRALVQVKYNPLGTLLTLLGVMFGVGSVVAMFSIGEGAKDQIVTAIESMGATNVHIKSDPVQKGELDEVIGRSSGLHRDDVRAIERIVDDVKGSGFRTAYHPEVSDLRIPVHDITVLGVSPSLPELHGLSIGEGRGLLSHDHRSARRVALLGPGLASRAFPESPIGRYMRLDYAYFLIVGVLDAVKGQEGEPLPIDRRIYDSAIVIPFSTLEAELMPRRSYGELDLVTLEAGSVETSVATKNVAEGILELLHGGVTDYQILAPEEISSQKQETQGVLNIVLVFIAAISLLVGGIGVMNTMLANIMERISEIGLRRVVGARRGDIRNQFLFESVTICCLGGIVGIGLGYVISFGVSHYFGLPVAFAWESMVASFIISVVVGVVFGYMPARKAAKINPIEALKSE